MTPSYQLSLFEKRCSKCGEFKPRTMYSPRKRAKDGLYPWCRDCARAQQRESYARHAETRRHRGLEAYYLHRERQLAANRRWCMAHKEKRRAYRQSRKLQNAALARESHRRHPAKKRAYARLYQLTHPEKKRRAETVRYQRVCAAGPLYTRLDINILFIEQEGYCYYCGASLEKGYHIDHKTPLSRDGTHARENLALTCQPCNQRKWTRTEAEYRAWLPTADVIVKKLPGRKKISGIN
jgi:5-methylcytosine-specific restriction endonuclease McrA